MSSYEGDAMEPGGTSRVELERRAVIALVPYGCRELRLTGRLLVVMCAGVIDTRQFEWKPHDLQKQFRFTPYCN